MQHFQPVLLVHSDLVVALYFIKGDFPMNKLHARMTRWGGLILAVAMILSCMTLNASASTFSMTDDEQAGAWLVNDAPMDDFVASQIRLEQTTAQYCPETATVRINLRLTTASKLSLLDYQLYPGYQLREELERLERFNDPELLLHAKIYSGQNSALWDLLSAETQTKVTTLQQSWQVLDVLRQCQDYADPTIRQIVDDYTNCTLGGSQLRWALSKLTGMAADSYNIPQLLELARNVCASEQYVAYEQAMRPLRYCSHDADSFELAFAPAELSAIYAELCTATTPIVGSDYLAQLDSYQVCIHLPV